jgi:lysozyme
MSGRLGWCINRLLAYLHRVGCGSAPGYMVNSAMVTNFSGVELIKSHEGLALKAYLDSNGKWACGYGHQSGVTEGTTCTPDIADKWLKEDLDIFENVVSHSVTVPLNNNQFSACVSLCYNIGPEKFKNSSIVRLLNASHYDLAANAFLLWDKINGKESPGIMHRRNDEKALFLRPVPFVKDSARN